MILDALNINEIIDFFTSELKLTIVFDWLGTVAFAISGVRLASGKDIDWFGAYIVGLVTAVGGGTLRDLLIGLTPFWLLDPIYVILSLVAFIIVVFFSKKLIRINESVFIFDAIGLGLFTVVGIERTLMLGFPFWVAIIMGVVTGSFGGLIRDICINEVPLVFRSDIYAVACAIGACAYGVGMLLGLQETFLQIICAVAIIVIRILAVKYKWSLPILRGGH